MKRVICWSTSIFIIICVYRMFGLEESLLERLVSLPLYLPDRNRFLSHGGFDPLLLTKLVRNYRLLLWSFCWLSTLILGLQLTLASECEPIVLSLTSSPLWFPCLLLASCTRKREIDRECISTPGHILTFWRSPPSCSTRENSCPVLHRARLPGEQKYIRYKIIILEILNWFGC